MATDKPSSLTVRRNTVDPSSNSKKRKLDDEDLTWPPTKRPALDHEDNELLKHLFDFLKSPVIKDEYPEDYVAINDEGVNASPNTCPYEGIVDEAVIYVGCRSVATNTMHVPVQIRQAKRTRSNVWNRAAQQSLNEEDRGDKWRGLGPMKYINDRKEQQIWAYYDRYEYDL